MYKEIQIGNKTVGMEGNASIPYRYNQIFHDGDFFKKFAGQAKDGGEGEAIDLYIRLGFIMAKAAEKADMSKLNMDSFMAWVGEFESLDLMNAVGEIASVYLGQKDQNAVPKSEPAPQSGNTQ